MWLCILAEKIITLGKQWFSFLMDIWIHTGTLVAFAGQIVALRISHRRKPCRLLIAVWQLLPCETVCLRRHHLVGIVHQYRTHEPSSLLSVRHGRLYRDVCCLVSASMPLCTAVLFAPPISWSPPTYFSLQSQNFVY